MIITIPGKPIPKARNRRKKIGRLTIDYDPQEKEKQSVRNQIAYQLRLKQKETQLEDATVAPPTEFQVHMTFYMPIVKSTTKAQRSLLSAGLYHNKKPDLTNLAKFYEDCANGLLYHDDSQIVVLTCKKIYSENPRTVITIEALN